MSALPLKCRRCLFFVFFVQAITTPDIGTPRFNQQFAHKGFFKIALRCFYTLTNCPQMVDARPLIFHRRATTLKRPCFTISHAILLLFYLYLSIL